MTENQTSEASHQAKVATTWACEVVKRAGWALATDPHNAHGWEVSRDGRTLVVVDWRDLCRFAKAEGGAR